jgi:N-acetylglucosaminyldiphosphoundecaprenol N-acetyl-beta-D-mannosaminyltransferase
MSKCDAKFSVLGVSINAVQIPDVIAQMEEWIARHEVCRYIAVTGMHGITEAQHGGGFRNILNAAGLVVPDGYPLVWLGRKKGFPQLRRRVYGPELMSAFWEQTTSKRYRHFFYGGAPGVADELAERAAKQYPGLEVVGTCSPPFRDLSAEEDRELVSMIDGARADIVWVGLGTPKQELWMFEHRKRLHVPVLVGVGAAFDFYTKRVAQAPEWMRENGLEWLFRLAREPRRLWRRYLLNGSKFAALVMLESLGFRKFR